MAPCVRVTKARQDYTGAARSPDRHATDTTAPAGARRPCGRRRAGRLFDGGRVDGTHTDAGEWSVVDDTFRTADALYLANQDVWIGRWAGDAYTGRGIPGQTDDPPS